MGEILFARPDRRNALSIAMQAEIIACLADWAEDDSIRCVSMRGQGVFSSGLDRNEILAAETREAAVASSKALHRAVAHFRKPLIAGIAGYALATAFDIAVLCDLRVMASDAVLGKPELSLGGAPLVMPLRWIVGDGHARDLALTGRRVGADEALRIGLVNHVVEPDQLAVATRALADDIAAAPLDALCMTKQFFIDQPAPESWLPMEHDAVFDRNLGVRPQYSAGKKVRT
ncbi:enoyl-CoA hydratase/isomerase family protein [Sphingomonas sp. SRS2]|uniref:enoyl-CoA hydratase/isomerase family protein n=1 Tax=Sphingomonas sp. SRS2 TaxID=133190 RepID=UPI001F38599D|nr:enoyl-CoA hydratase/isomerase family protein [Sphingomonas sp. SRS2]